MRGVYVVLCKLNLTLLIDLFCLDVHIFGSGHRKQAPSFSFFLFQFLSSLKQCIQTGFATMILKAAFLSNTNMFYKPKAKKQKQNVKQEEKESWDWKLVPAKVLNCCWCCAHNFCFQIHPHIDSRALSF